MLIIQQNQNEADVIRLAAALASTGDSKLTKNLMRMFTHLTVPYIGDAQEEKTTNMADVLDRVARMGVWSVIPEKKENKIRSRRV